MFSALHEVTLLQQELEETQTVRKLHEEQLLATKKQLTEVQYELTKAQVYKRVVFLEWSTMLVAVDISRNCAAVILHRGNVF